MTWTWDAPSGVYRNHTLSTDLRREAMYDVQTLKYLRPEPGYGKKKGDTLTITRVMQLPVAGRVGEMDVLPNGRPAINTKSVTVSEWGFKIQTTEFESNLAFFDIHNQFQQMLRDQMALTMDLMGAAALKTTPAKYTPQVGGGVYSTSGTPGGTATANMAIADLRFLRDQLRKNKTPYFRGGKYVGILSTRAARGIKNDPEYKDWVAPQENEPTIAGRMKDIEGFQLLETNNVFSFLDLIGASTVCGEAIFFGADPGFLAVVANPELRAGLPVELGRFRDVGWVGTLEASITWDIASLARVIHVSST
jgi:N4-gp56 family major capsid protein